MVRKPCMCSSSATWQTRLQRFFECVATTPTAVYMAEEALAVAKGRPPDAVIIKVFAYQMTEGLKDARRLSEVLPACNVILCSSNLQKASRFLPCGAGHKFPFLRRPQYPAHVPHFVGAADAIVSNTRTS